MRDRLRTHPRLRRRRFAVPPSPRQKGNNGLGNGGDDPVPGRSGGTGADKLADLVRSGENRCDTREGVLPAGERVFFRASDPGRPQLRQQFGLPH